MLYTNRPIIYKNNDKKDSITIFVLHELDSSIECILLGTKPYNNTKQESKRNNNLKLLRFQASKKKLLKVLIFFIYKYLYYRNINF